ncbi:uncharacterized protein JCM6883_003021 [Sporobolomyces salmoneus]|uniref:uncharacterized protein n=1 Tax=Sporobolomyces salmoneus TaxID=183962 RepID=UPI00317EF179
MAPSNSTASFSNAANLLKTFEYERTLSEDARALVVYLLGSAVPEGSQEKSPAIIKIEKTPYEPGEAVALTSPEAWSRLQMKTSNDIYSTSLAWFAPGRSTADVQITSICPATEKHILKYSTQEYRLVRETPQLYKSVVEPYINSIPPATIKWVYGILEGTAEAENVLFRDDDPKNGFVLTPDLKWDQKTMTSLYLLVLTQDRSIRSLRDLTPAHLPLLRNIRQASEKAAIEKYGIDKGELRFFVHYQPTYYHFHVHVVHVSYESFSGITVGQAHLLDDVIDTLELEESEGSPSDLGTYYSRKTFTYALGTNHKLYEGLSKAT